MIVVLRSQRAAPIVSHHLTTPDDRRATQWAQRPNQREKTVLSLLIFETTLPTAAWWETVRIWSRITSRIAEAVVSFPQRTFWSKACGMDGYAAEVEQKMRRFFGWRSEKDRRRYAAVEAAK